MNAVLAVHPLIGYVVVATSALGHTLLGDGVPLIASARRNTFQYVAAHICGHAFAYESCEQVFRVPASAIWRPCVNNYHGAGWGP